MAVVEIANVSKRYGDVPGSSGFQPDYQGWRICGVGRTVGLRKTTTMRMIAGLESVTEGSIRIGGKDVVGMIPMERDVAMVFQNYALFPHMNVFWESFVRSAAPQDAQSKTIEEEVRKAAKILNIEHLRPAGRENCPEVKGSGSHSGVPSSGNRRSS
mgnify:CR=1 FL=1